MKLCVVMNRSCRVHLWWLFWAVLPLCRAAIADDTKEAEAESAVPTDQRVAELDVEIAALDQQSSVAQAEWKQLQNEAADLKLKLSFFGGSP